MEQINRPINDFDGAHIDSEQMQAILRFSEEATEAVKRVFDAMISALKPVIESAWQSV